MPPPRRFPPPWTVEDIGAAFVVTDSTGQLAYVYLDDEPGRRIKLQEWRANQITLRNVAIRGRYGGPGARTFR